RTSHNVGFASGKKREYQPTFMVTGRQSVIPPELQAANTRIFQPDEARVAELKLRRKFCAPFPQLAPMEPKRRQTRTDQAGARRLGHGHGAEVEETGIAQDSQRRDAIIPGTAVEGARGVKLGR